MSLTFGLALEADRWRVMRADGDRIDCEHVEITADDSPVDVLVAVRAALDHQGYHGQPVCLALPASQALSAPIDCSGLPRRDRRMAMLYRLEEQLPLEAERLTADFLPAAAGRALGVAVETSPLVGLLDALGEIGIEIAAICPVALLALLGSSDQHAEPVDYAVLSSSDGVDIFRMSSGTPVSWYTVQSDPTDVLRCIHADMLASPAADERVTVGLIGDTDTVLADAMHESSDLRCCTLSDDDTPTAAARGAALLAGGKTDWTNLRRDGLAIAHPWGRFSRLLTAAAILLIGLLIAASATFLWRGHQYRSLARGAESDQAAIFAELLPNRPVPPGIKSRLQSELKRRSGDSSATGGLPSQMCALESLRTIMAHLPDDMRLRITNLRLAESSLRITGEARSHSDAGTIRQSLVAGGLEIDPPQTERLAAGGVSFTLTGKPLQGGLR